MSSCPSENTQGIDESSFIENGTLNFDAHRIGWIVAGSFTIATIIVTGINIWRHCRHYSVPDEQRQIVRILLMPAVYGCVSFLGYYFYREYYYYCALSRDMTLPLMLSDFVEVAYEAFAIAAFLALLLVFVGKSDEDQRAILRAKEKVKIPFPLCCWRWRPGKPYALWLLKWSVLQYCFLRPLISIIAAVTQYYDVYCPSVYSPHFAAAYLDSVDFVSISVALYGLIALYALTRDVLRGHQPLSKFLTIKLIASLRPHTFYQGFIFSLLAAHEVLKATMYWTTYNVANGLQCLATCIEMLIFAVAMIYTFSPRQYIQLSDGHRTPFWRGFLNALNFSDFAIELWRSSRFFFDFARKKEGTHASHEKHGPWDMATIGDAANDSRASMHMAEKKPDHANGYANGTASPASYPPLQPPVASEPRPIALPSFAAPTDQPTSPASYAARPHEPLHNPYDPQATQSGYAPQSQSAPNHTGGYAK